MSAVPCPQCVKDGNETPADLIGNMAMTISFASKPAQLDVEALLDGVASALAEAGQPIEYSVARGLMQYEPGLFPEAGMVLWETHDRHHTSPGDPA